MLQQDKYEDDHAEIYHDQTIGSQSNKQIMKEVNKLCSGTVVQLRADFSSERGRQGGITSL